MYVYTEDDDKIFAAQMAAKDEYDKGYAQGKKDAQQPKWISVKERLPDGECIAFGHGEMLVGYVYEDEGGHITCESEGVLLLNVTHWMQPELPEEDS